MSTPAIGQAAPARNINPPSYDAKKDERAALLGSRVAKLERDKKDLQCFENGTIAGCSVFGCITGNIAWCAADPLCWLGTAFACVCNIAVGIYGCKKSGEYDSEIAEARLKERVAVIS